MGLPSFTSTLAEDIHNINNRNTDVDHTTTVVFNEACITDPNHKGIFATFESSDISALNNINSTIIPNGAMRQRIVEAKANLDYFHHWSPNWSEVMGIDDNTEKLDRQDHNSAKQVRLVRDDNVFCTIQYQGHNPADDEGIPDDIDADIDDLVARDPNESQDILSAAIPGILESAMEGAGPEYFGTPDDPNYGLHLLANMYAHDEMSTETQAGEYKEGH
ncbi:uncharacterized protein GGS25DRAFT_433552 [Hypoxylon fragiforme]|uniref:uncharacterized protein n=1 Tax=Hypoxylon fragiforme TaxID=63214 RepID=UPI0020C7210A|nr:uncharacterized protein GGS25DRAFT_433552 [Hypoxylon fragiforme]KAI2605514.1 hypothetical protein GGS25DRAFT_433552 [Hypoxylon fragiforme]